MNYCHFDCLIFKFSLFEQSTLMRGYVSANRLIKFRPFQWSFCLQAKRLRRNGEQQQRNMIEFDIWSLKMQIEVILICSDGSWRWTLSESVIMIVFFVDFRIKQTWRRKTENSQKPYSESTQFLEREEADKANHFPANSQPTKELRHNSLAIEHHMSSRTVFHKTFQYSL